MLTGIVALPFPFNGTQALVRHGALMFPLGEAPALDKVCVDDALHGRSEGLVQQRRLIPKPSKPKDAEVAIRCGALCLGLLFALCIVGLGLEGLWHGDHRKLALDTGQIFTPLISREPARTWRLIAASIASLTFWSVFTARKAAA